MMSYWAELGVIAGLVLQLVAAIAYVLRLEGRLNVHGERFETVKAQFAAVDHRFLAMEGSLARIESKVDRLIERQATVGR